MENDLKMYILIKDTAPPDLVPLIASHAAMGAYRQFEGSPLMEVWFQSPLFKKVICKVSAEQFEEAKKHGAYYTLTEDKHRELGELGLGFDIQSKYGKFFQFLRLYKV